MPHTTHRCVYRACHRLHDTAVGLRTRNHSLTLEESYVPFPFLCGSISDLSLQHISTLSLRDHPPPKSFRLRRPEPATINVLHSQHQLTPLHSPSDALGIGESRHPKSPSTRSLSPVSSNLATIFYHRTTMWLRCRHRSARTRSLTLQRCWGSPRTHGLK
jgi:hypothetical protein